MPRYEPKRNAEPFLKAGDTLKMRRTADGTFKPVPVAVEPDPDPAAEEPREPTPPQDEEPGTD